jgi:hypothetical protein
MNEENAVLNAYDLYKDNLISKEVFVQTIEKIKGTPSPTPAKAPVSTPAKAGAITPGQIDLINRLKEDGRIPKTQTLEITKAEAQIIIHNALLLPKPAQETKPQPSQAELDGLYDELPDY